MTNDDDDHDDHDDVKVMVNGVTPCLDGILKDKE